MELVYRHNLCEVNMVTDRTAPDINSITRFSVTRNQYIIAAVALIALLGVGVTTLMQSQVTVKQTKVLSDVETPAASIIFTQRETLVYATRLAQWSNGGTTRRQVQIARNLLAQRLSVIDASGKSMGERADATYWNSLKTADRIVSNSVPGILPENMHAQVQEQVAPVVDQILASARDLVVSYQQFIDRAEAEKAKKIADGSHRQLIFFYIFIFFSALFLALNVRSNFRNYRLAREIIESEQLRLEKTLAELSLAQVEVNKLLDLDHAKNAFISTVNHELRTPLTSIIGYIDVIKEEKESIGVKDLSRYLEVLERNAQILLNLVESILSLSKIDASEGKIADAKVDLVKVIDNTIFVLQPNSNSANIKVAFNFDPEQNYFVRGDAGQLSQVFLNLLGNAIKFSPKDSSVEFSMVNAQEAGLPVIRIRVSDHGIGIPEDDMGKLFQRFFRAKNAVADQFQGTGLGLSIVDQSVRLHGGTVEVESKLGLGTTFIIELPSYLEDEEKLILQRREGVLVRAIERITQASPDKLKDVTHEIGGAIGFYGFEQEAKLILEHSRELARQEAIDAADAARRKKEMLAILQVSLDRVKKEKV
jgi:signal transduction histidine kinase